MKRVRERRADARDMSPAVVSVASVFMRVSGMEQVDVFGASSVAADSIIGATKLGGLNWAAQCLTRSASALTKSLLYQGCNLLTKVLKKQRGASNDCRRDKYQEHAISAPLHAEHLRA